MIWGLISRIAGGRAVAIASHPAQTQLAEEIDRGIANARERRLARPARVERERFERARAKVEQLRHERAMQHVDF